MKMEQSVPKRQRIKFRNPTERIHHSERGESFKSRITVEMLNVKPDGT
jgi:hypothetical protein